MKSDRPYLIMLILAFLTIIIVSFTACCKEYSEEHPSINTELTTGKGVNSVDGQQYWTITTHSDISLPSETLYVQLVWDVETTNKLFDPSPIWRWVSSDTAIIAIPITTATTKAVLLNKAPPIGVGSRAVNIRAVYYIGSSGNYTHHLIIN